MNSYPFISIIVPVYKAEPYLHQCLDSILNQTYQTFELILIDDGSPDASGTICEDYAARDPRICVIHQQNSGPSSCRNRGMGMAKGNYICFIDSDDWVEHDYLESMVVAVQLHPATDLVVSGFVLDGKQRKELKVEDGWFTMADKISFHQLVVSRLLFGPCQKLYSSSLIQKIHLEFPLHIRYGEDRLFNYAFLQQVESIATVHRAAYHYRIHESGSLSSNPYPNMFELEYSQWKALYQLYSGRDLLTEESEKYLWRDFYWLMTDHLLNARQLDYHRTRKEKFAYLSSLLKTPEIRQLKTHQSYLKDVSWTQFTALTCGFVCYFYLIYLLKRKNS